jgi:hypothetical protein
MSPCCAPLVSGIQVLRLFLSFAHQESVQMKVGEEGGKIGEGVLSGVFQLN